VRFVAVAFYGTEDDAGIEIVNTEKCGLCGADPLKDAVIRLLNT